MNSTHPLPEPSSVKTDIASGFGLQGGELVFEALYQSATLDASQVLADLFCVLDWLFEELMNDDLVEGIRILVFFFGGGILLPVGQDFRGRLEDAFGGGTLGGLVLVVLSELLGRTG